MGSNLCSGVSQYDKNYWQYCGILIPNTINSVPAMDGINTIKKNGCSTKKGTIPNPLAPLIYQYKYSKRSLIDGKLYWIED